MKTLLNIMSKLKSHMIRIMIPMLNKNISIGKGFTVRKGVRLNANGGKITIGNCVFMNAYSSINAHMDVRIGNNVLMGENVHIYDHNHVFKDTNALISSQGFKSKPVIIGDNCWLGTNVVILPGVKIGNNCVIGANCLIYKDIPENTIVKCNQGLIFEQRAEMDRK